MGQHRILVYDTINSLLIKSDKRFDPRCKFSSVHKIMIMKTIVSRKIKDCVQYYSEVHQIGKFNVSQNRKSIKLSLNQLMN